MDTLISRIRKMIDRQQQDERGFTLVETIVSMVIFAIFAMTALQTTLSITSVQKKLEDRGDAVSSAQQTQLSLASLAKANAVEVYDNQPSQYVLIQANRTRKGGQECVAYQLDRNTHTLYRKTSKTRINAAGTDFSGWQKVGSGIDGTITGNDDMITIDLTATVGASTSRSQATITAAGMDTPTVHCLTSDDSVPANG